MAAIKKKVKYSKYIDLFMHNTFLGVYYIYMCRLLAEVHGGGLGAEPPEASEINFLNLDYSLHQI